MKGSIFQTTTIALGIFLIIGSGGGGGGGGGSDDTGDITPDTPSNFKAVSAYKGALLSWDAASNASSYELCYAMETITNFSNCADYNGGTMYSVGAATSSALSTLTAGTPYYFQVRAKNSAGMTGAPSVTAIATPGLGLNDTGITVCREDGLTNVACSSSLFPDQDADHGLDATATNNADGHAGFTFIRLNESGAEVDSSAMNWACAKDQNTGLVWEVKSATGSDSLHSASDSFTWYSTNTQNNAGTAGDDNSASDTCYGYDGSDASSYCNTEAFIDRVNDAGYCGLTNWRLPTRQELNSIVNYDEVEPAADFGIFQNTTSDLFWSATSVYSATFSGEQAWATNFNYGGSTMVDKTESHSARLVSDGQ